MQTVQIRAGQVQDAAEVAALEARCFPKAEAADEPTLRARLQAFTSCFWVACMQGRIVGMVNGAMTDEMTICDDMFEDVRLHDPNGKYQSVFGLDVHPDVQHRGIAQQLMRHLIAVARSQGKAGVILTCKQQLISFYEQFGFQCLGVSASVHGGAVWYDMLLPFA